MDERRLSGEPERRRKKPENPLLQADSQKSGQKNQKKTDPGMKERTGSRRVSPENTGRESAQGSMQKKNVYKLRILTIILVLLILALIAAFVTEIGIYGRKGRNTSENAGITSVQAGQIQNTDADIEGTGMGDSLAGL